MANVISFKNLTDQYYVEYKNRKEDCFLVETESRIVRFERTGEGLYGFKFDNNYLETVVEENEEPSREISGVTTLAENRSNYSNNKFGREQCARKLYHTIGAPSIKNFKAIIRSNQIDTNPSNIFESVFAATSF